jgi:lysophospholipase L1-like esterase
MPADFRLRHLALFALLLAPALSRAQTAPTTQRLYDTLPTMTELYATRTAKFEAEPVVPGRIIFFGNSITQGGDWARLTGDSTVLNRGIGGDVTFGLLHRLHDITVRQPSKLFILIGINDISRDIPDAVIAANYRTMIGQVRSASPKTAIYVQSILPVNPDVPNFPQHYDKNEHVLAVNRLLRAIVREMHVRYVDLHPLFLDSRGRLDARYTGDGLHLNALGYQRWVEHLKKIRAL